MEFARKVWHLLVGIKDGLVLVFMLLFFFMLYAVLTARPGPVQLQDGALLIRLDGAVVEETAPIDPFASAFSGEEPIKEYAARDLVRALRLAAEDRHIKAVVLDLSGFAGGGLVHMQEVGAAMDAVRAAKKPVLTWAQAYGDDGVMLAAHSSEVWVDPMGGAFVTGPGGNRLYYGALLAKLKIQAHVYKVGTYKDFVEPFTRNDQSEPSRAARIALYDALWESWKSDVAKARPKAQIERVTSDPVGWLKAAGGDTAKASLDAGLVDKIGDEVAFGERVKDLAGEDPGSNLPGSYAGNRMSTLLAAHPENHRGAAVAVVTVAGDIVDGDAGPGTAGGERVTELIDQANADGASALVLRVDSPGGSVVASEQIRLALERFKADGRPVVVSMANLGASGGYWVSTPAQRIFAEPATVTGSIGIFAIVPSFERSLAELGVSGDGVRTTPLSGQPDLLTGLTPEIEAMLQAGIEHGYARFTSLVAKSRGKSQAEIERVAEGRVWDGGSARQFGLVDQFGGLDEAIDYAAKAAKLDDWYASYYATPVSPFAEFVARILENEEQDDRGSGHDRAGRDLFGLMAQRQRVQVNRALGDLVWLSGTRGAQAYCLDCPVNPAATRARRAEVSWLGRLAEALALR